MRTAVPLLLVFIGCTGAEATSQAPAAPVAPVPSASASPKPFDLDAFCARAVKIAKLPDDVGCRRDFGELAETDPELVACLSKCIEGATDEETFAVCARDACPPIVHPDAEGLRAIGSIEMGSKNVFQVETDASGTGAGPYVHRFCPSSAKPVPETLPPYGETVDLASSAWATPTWQCLKFSLEGPTHFQYAYEWNGVDGPDARYVATAKRRLKNGKIRVVRLRGKGSSTGDAEREKLEIVDE